MLLLISGRESGHEWYQPIINSVIEAKPIIKLRRKQDSKNPAQKLELVILLASRAVTRFLMMHFFCSIYPS